MEETVDDDLVSSLHPTVTILRAGKEANPLTGEASAENHNTVTMSTERAHRGMQPVLSVSDIAHGHVCASRLWKAMRCAGIHLCGPLPLSHSPCAT